MDVNSIEFKAEYDDRGEHETLMVDMTRVKIQLYYNALGYTGGGWACGRAAPQRIAGPAVPH